MSLSLTSLKPQEMEGFPETLKKYLKDTQEPCQAILELCDRFCRSTMTSKLIVDSFYLGQSHRDS